MFFLILIFLSLILIFLLFPVFLKTALSFYSGLFLDIAESYDKEEYLDEIFTTKSVKY
jgi:hypothetical protein